MDENNASLNGDGLAYVTMGSAQNPVISDDSAQSGGTFPVSPQVPANYNVDTIQSAPINNMPVDYQSEPVVGFGVPENYPQAAQTSIDNQNITSAIAAPAQAFDQNQYQVQMPTNNAYDPNAAVLNNIQNTQIPEQVYQPVDNLQGTNPQANLIQPNTIQNNTVTVDNFQPPVQQTGVGGALSIMNTVPVSQIVQGNSASLPVAQEQIMPNVLPLINISNNEVNQNPTNQSNINPTGNQAGNGLAEFRSIAEPPKVIQQIVKKPSINIHSSWESNEVASPPIAQGLNPQELPKQIQTQNESIPSGELKKTITETRKPIADMARILDNKPTQIIDEVTPIFANPSTTNTQQVENPVLSDLEVAEETVRPLYRIMFDSVLFYFKNFKNLLTFSLIGMAGLALAFLPYYILKGYFPAIGLNIKNNEFWTMISLGFGILFGLLSGGLPLSTIISVIMREQVEETVNFRGAVQLGARNYLVFLLNLFTYLAGVALGLFIFIIPGIIMMVHGVFGMFTAFEDQINPSRAFRKGWKLTHYYAWDIWLAIIVLMILFGSIAYGFSFIPVPMLDVFLNILLIPFWIIIMYTLYSDIRKAQENRTAKNHWAVWSMMISLAISVAILMGGMVINEKTGILSNSPIINKAINSAIIPSSLKNTLNNTGSVNPDGSSKNGTGESSQNGGGNSQNSNNGSGATGTGIKPTTAPGTPVTPTSIRVPVTPEPTEAPVVPTEEEVIQEYPESIF